MLYSNCTDYYWTIFLKTPALANLPHVEKVTFFIMQRSVDQIKAPYKEWGALCLIILPKLGFLQ